MATGEAPALAIPKPPRWKFVFFKAAGFAAGITFALVVLAGIVWWWSRRPTPPKPWNRNAIKATWKRVFPYQDGNTWKLKFSYDLENTTDKDFELQKYSSYRLAAKLADTHSLVGFGSEDEILFSGPVVFVPAHQRTRVEIILTHYGKDVPHDNPGADAPIQEREQYYKSVADAVAKKMSNLDGFMLFDDGTRYQIDFSATWKPPAPSTQNQ